MRFTRRLLDWRAAAAVTATFAMVVTASCTSDDEHDASRLDDLDAGGGDGFTDAPSADGSSSPRDAGAVDAAALPVVCESKPCALSLVTTFGAGDEDRGEGFCARLDDGTVACWGANGAGQLGRGEEAGSNDDPTPARVVGLAKVVDLDHSCALDDAGAVYCWGTGPWLSEGERAQTTTARSPVKLPLPPATRIGVGAMTACAATSTGVLCWGSNELGQVAPFDTAPRFESLEPHVVALPQSVSVRDIAVDRASFVIGEDGVVRSWGANPPLARESSLSPDPHPLPIELAGVSSLDVARDNACATARGIGYCWGAVTPQPQDPVDATLLVRAFPRPVVTPEPVARIATTRNVVITDKHTGTVTIEPQRWCAVGVSGDVYCWGNNASGQAGDGTTSDAVATVKVAGLPGPAADVKTTPGATCALLTSGKVHCWGSNFYGQLGTGKLKVPSLVPQEVKLP